ncbi:MAG: hypothetical protein RBG13Loki_3432 [Promethearchaeota archaeon CR_4]|nr:MAG: hypothetical protein RBG13Loki_3432 [Candidatus Lokiarchaeota archaeon CR_4]
MNISLPYEVLFVNTNEPTVVERKTQKITSSSEEAVFLQRLSNLDRGEIAILKRNSGATIGESKGAMPLFYSLLPSSERAQYDEEIFFLVATLWAWTYKEERPRPPKRPWNDFGETMRLVREDPNSSPEAVNRRISILLDSQFSALERGRPCGGELAYRLRQCVKLATSKEKGVDWLQLLQDLRWWNHPQKRVQKRWIHSYFGTRASETSPAKGDKTLVNENLKDESIRQLPSQTPTKPTASIIAKQENREEISKPNLPKKSTKTSIKRKGQV